jgi:cell wall-associated NlpC family hydrolase
MPLVKLATQADADSVMSALVAQGVGPDASWTGAFREPVEVTNVAAQMTELTTTSSAFSYIMTGGIQEDIYTIQDGDSVWQLAQDKGISEDEIAAMNPGLDVELVHTGDQIKFTKAVPFVNYEATGMNLVTKKVGFETTEEKTKDLYVGETKVKQDGVKGEKRVLRSEVRVNGNVESYEVVSEQAISAPTDKIVLVGTKARPASSYSSGSSKGSNFKGGAGVVADAYALLGIPYRSGGSSPSSGFDCSGFTSYIYKQNGLSIPRTSTGQSSAGRYIKLSDAKPGDVVCWGGVGSSYHVGIYVGGNKYIDAPRTGKNVSLRSFSYYRPSFAVRF